jgi:hypothetical protein
MAGHRQVLQPRQRPAEPFNESHRGGQDFHRRYFCDYCKIEIVRCISSFARARYAADSRHYADNKYRYRLRYLLQMEQPEAEMRPQPAALAGHLREDDTEGQSLREPRQSAIDVI